MILASRSLFRAFLAAEILASWRAPEGLTARIERFVPRIGGGYRIVLTYAKDTGQHGKSAPGEDVAEVRFVELAGRAHRRGGLLRLGRSRLSGADDDHDALQASCRRHQVTFAATNVPAEIDAEDHKTAMVSSLRNLALLTE